MSLLHYHQQQLFMDHYALSDIAGQFGTPCYVYSQRQLVETFQAFDAAFAQHQHLICYAVKANSNLSILNLFAQMGAGFDVVSGGELTRVITAGGDPAKVVFSGVGKTVQEMQQALLAGIHCFNVESAPELERLSQVATALARPAPVSLRVNPDIDAKTHPYISTGLKNNKFGIAYEEALALYQHAASLPYLDIQGIDCHIGSQITELSPFVEALNRVLTLVETLRHAGITLHHIDIGGGIGIRYGQESPPSFEVYAETIMRQLGGLSFQLILEPGRALVGNAGVLLTQVEYLKRGQHKNFAIVDAAMNDLLRPALYDSYHHILPLRQRDTPEELFEVVGPICETGDFLGHDRHLALVERDLLAICSAGAYGMSMSSNYNTRPRAAEVMIHHHQARLIRARETLSDLLRAEIAQLDPQ